MLTYTQDLPLFINKRLKNHIGLQVTEELMKDTLTRPINF